jgi:hypothetical protein
MVDKTSEAIEKQQRAAAMRAFDRLPKSLKYFINYHPLGFTNEAIIAIASDYKQVLTAKQLLALLRARYGKESAGMRIAE